MKKILLTALLAVGMCCTAIAQDDKKNTPIKFGVKAGINLANASGNGIDLFTDGEKSDSKLGITIGAFLEYEISEKFSIQPEIFYSQQGFKKNISNSDEFTLKLDYINIPILAKYNASDNFSFLLGPQIGFLLSSKLDREQEERPLVAVKSDEVETDSKEFFKKTDVGLNFGLHYEFDNGLGINARYYVGLKDIFDFTTADVITDSNFQDKATVEREGNDYVIKNNVLNVSVFYTF